MDSILTIRMDETVKAQGAAVFERCGYTPSSAVRRLYEYAIKNGSLPFSKEERPSVVEVKKRIARFDACQTKEPVGMTDDEVRAARMREVYGLDA